MGFLSTLRSRLGAPPRRHYGPITFEDLSEQLPPRRLPPLDRPGVDEGRLTPEQAAWRRDGVLVLPGFLPDDLVDAYVARRARHDNPAGWIMPTPYLHVPELRALALYPPLLRMMERLVGEPMMLHLALTGWISTQRDWHQDDYLNPPFVANWYAAVWMALDDISGDSGPFEYLPGSHRWGLLRGEKVRAFLTPEELARREPVTGTNEWPTYSERFVTPGGGGEDRGGRVASTAVPGAQGGRADLARAADAPGIGCGGAGDGAAVADHALLGGEPPAGHAGAEDGCGGWGLCGVQP